MAYVVHRQSMYKADGSCETYKFKVVESGFQQAPQRPGPSYSVRLYSYSLQAAHRDDDRLAAPRSASHT